MSHEPSVARGLFKRSGAILPMDLRTPLGMPCHVPISLLFSTLWTQRTYLLNMDEYNFCREL
jgi:hypothetical protein